MGNRLNVELTNREQVLCGCCWHERAFTDEALDLTEAIVKCYDDVFGGSGADLFVAEKIFETMGGGITGVERERLHKELGNVLEIHPARSIYDGIIALTEEGIREARRWEKARVRIDLASRKIDFHVHYFTYLEEYVEFCDRVPDCIEWADLPRIDADPDIFDGIYFDHIPMVRRIVLQCPNGFRLRNGDVIEWM